MKTYYKLTRGKFTNDLSTDFKWKKLLNSIKTLVTIKTCDTFES